MKKQQQKISRVFHSQNYFFVKKEEEKKTIFFKLNKLFVSEREKKRIEVNRWQTQRIFNHGETAEYEFVLNLSVSFFVSPSPFQSISA